MMPSVTITETRQRHLKDQEAECDANGNVSFCRSANGIGPADLGTIFANGGGKASLVSNGRGSHGLPTEYVNDQGTIGAALCGIEPEVVNGHVSRHDLEKETETSSWLRQIDVPLIVRFTVTGAAGVVFGLAMEKGRVFEPHNIRGQMLFQNFVMLKMFLSAIVAGIVMFSLLSLLPFTSATFRRARSNLGGRMTSKGVAAAAVGGGMLGSGMALSGACPGATLIEVGAGVQHAGMTFIGCLLGALLFGFTEQYIIRLLKPTTPLKYSKVDEYRGVPYHTLALPLALVIVLGLALIEYFAPWRSELTRPNADHIEAGVWGVLTLRSWPPIFAGALVGCLQLPIVLAVEEPIGGSRGYCTMVSRVFPAPVLEKWAPYLTNTRSGLRSWWQVVYITSAIGGGAASSLLSGTWASTVGVPPFHALLGGAVMVYGSRLAGGCTSGHGLSGIGMLSVLSFVAIPAMFAGGVMTAVAMTLLGIY